MLGVGWTEMLVIGVVALIVIGPKELPAVMQKIGRFAGTIRRMGADFQRELNKTTGLDEVRNLRNAITQPLKQTTDAIRKEFNTTTSSGKVEPSGALKPADPKAESVVTEIHQAAGLPKPAEPAKAGAAGAAAQPTDRAKTAGVTPVAPSSAAPPATAPQLDPSAKPKRTRKAPAKKAAAGAASTNGTGPSTKSAAPTKKASPKAAAAADKPKSPRKRKPAAKKSS